ncbi:MAG: hypothetical protein CL583_13140 [Alteromonadaceae bacterium]|nr:hypothetical protein [Alteromonadaceae bacterium]|tara:strand:- start:1128 stop:1673 length:546 start_codon:yes stop_codon:yes gene_type:complete
MITSVKRLASGRVAYYAYADKGGPLLGRGEGDNKREARRDLNRQLQKSNSRRVAAIRKKGAKKTREELLRSELRVAVSAARSRAAKSGRPFDIDPDWAVHAMEAAEYRCALTGIRLEPRAHYTGDSHRGPWSISLDRIDNAGGYTKDNVRIVCCAINIAINEWGENVFERVARNFLNRKPQ